MGQKKLKVLGALIVIFQITIIIIYGFVGEFSNIPNVSISGQQNFLPVYMYMGLFAIGMGLILSYYRSGMALGMGTAIFAIVLNVQLSPLFQKFWFNIFVDQFGRDVASGSTEIFVQIQEMAEVRMSVFIQRNAMAMTISYLIACLATIGRTGLFQIFTSLLVYNFFWPLAFFCNIKLFLEDAPTSLALFDDFGLTYIYTFAAFFGLVYGIILNIKSQQSNLDKAETSSTSIVMSIFGVTLVFATLPTTILIFPFITADARYNYGFFNMYLAQIASILTTVAFSLVFGKGKLGVQNIIVATFSGASICAQFASGQVNLAACLVTGGIAGLFTSIWMQMVHPKLNRTMIKDSFGLIGAVLIPSFVGATIVTPIIYRAYLDNSWDRPSGKITDADVIRFNFIYYFITVGAAAFAGLIAGLFSFLTKGGDNFKFKKMFSTDYGLCNNSVENITERSLQDKKSQDSAKNLNS